MKVEQKHTVAEQVNIEEVGYATCFIYCSNLYILLQDLSNIKNVITGKELAIFNLTNNKVCIFPYGTRVTPVVVGTIEYSLS